MLRDGIGIIKVEMWVETEGSIEAGIKYVNCANLFRLRYGVRCRAELAKQTSKTTTHFDHSSIRI